METKFQTSFIPKKPLVTGDRPKTTAGVSVFMAFAVVLFIASLAGAGFVFAWKELLLDNQEKYRIELADHEKRFDVATIERLKKKNVKIDFAKELLRKHLSVSEIFGIIGGLTIDGVRFSGLEYVAPEGTGISGNGSDGSMAKISMKGLANSFSSIAWQSDVFGSSQKYGTNKIIKNPVLGDLAVDANGYVNFSFSANIDPTDISYEKALVSTLQKEGLLVPNDPQPTNENPQ